VDPGKDGDDNPIVNVTIGAPTRGTFDGGLLLRRSFSPQTNAWSDWSLAAEWVDTHQYTDTQVSNGVRYQYRMRPRVAFSTSNSLIQAQATAYAYARTAQSREATAKDDPYAPTGSVLINGGAPTTRHRLVDLTLTADDSGPAGDVGIGADLDVGTPTSDLEMRISNSPDFTGVPWWPFSDRVIDWDLGDVPLGGEATVYVRFRDEAGNVSDTAFAQSATIRYVGNRVFLPIVIRE
jgi:hypothetical protein